MSRCPTCSGSLNWVPEYRQWYCHSCRGYRTPVQEQQFVQPPAQQLIQPIQHARTQVNCHQCNLPPVHIIATDQHYCERCKIYVTPNAAPQPQQPVQQHYQEPQPYIPPQQVQPVQQPAPVGQASGMNMNLVIHALDRGTTVFDKSMSSVLFLPGEMPRPLGTVTLERAMTGANMTMFKGELLLTPYRLVFVEKSRFLDPNWISYWFNVDFEGMRFQTNGPGGSFDCSGVYLEMEQKQMGRCIDIRVRNVIQGGGLAPLGMFHPPTKIYNLALYPMLAQSRDSAPPVKASVLHSHLMEVMNPSGTRTFGIWDSAMERALRNR